MRVIGLSLLVFSLTSASLHAEFFDTVTGHSVRYLAELENNIEEKYGVTDLDSFLAKKASLESGIERLHKLSAETGMTIIDLDTEEEVAVILQRQLDDLILSYTTVRPDWRAELAEREARSSMPSGGYFGQMVMIPLD